jgi:hypothetical protein
MVAGMINTWIGNARLRPRIEWGTGDARISLEGDLLGALAMQMLLVVSGPDAWGACSACGRPFSPDREPRPGEAQADGTRGSRWTLFPLSPR